jgi:hypothetical protein
MAKSFIDKLQKQFENIESVGSYAVALMIIGAIASIIALSMVYFITRR